MTIIDAGARPSTFQRAPTRGADPAGGVVTITDTTELRWFAEGPMPHEIEAWFTCDGRRGLVERRTDTYRMDGRRDTGIKRRFGETLELKVRRSIGEQLAVGPGLSGRLEVWRRWSPAECLVVGGANVPWADVGKTVVKRRFSVSGDELELTEDNRQMTGAGCDVEIAAVEVDDVQAWTFAFAAFGPIGGRRDSLSASIAALGQERTPLAPVGSLFGPSCGYPEWLALVGSRRSVVSTCALRRR